MRRINIRFFAALVAVTAAAVASVLIDELWIFADAHGQLLEERVT
jgi:hypothetical protein